VEWLADEVKGPSIAEGTESYEDPDDERLDGDTEDEIRDLTPQILQGAIRNVAREEARSAGVNTDEYEPIAGQTFSPQYDQFLERMRANHREAAARERAEREAGYPNDDDDYQPTRILTCGRCNENYEPEEGDESCPFCPIPTTAPTWTDVCFECGSNLSPGQVCNHDRAVSACPLCGFEMAESATGRFHCQQCSNDPGVGSNAIDRLFRTSAERSRQAARRAPRPDNEPSTVWQRLHKQTPKEPETVWDRLKNEK